MICSLHFAFIHQEARKLCFYSPKTDKTYFFGLAVRRQAILDWNSDFGVYFLLYKGELWEDFIILC